jgi:hypothetical protein
MKIVLLSIVLLFSQFAFGQSNNTYIYGDEDIGYELKYSFTNGVGYFEMGYSPYYEYLMSEQQFFNGPEYVNGFPCVILSSQYTRRYYRDFLIINMAGHDFLFFMTLSGEISVLIPMEKSPDNRWYSFWGVENEKCKDGYFLYHGGERNLSSFLTEKTRGNTISYSATFGLYFSTENSMWVEGVDGLGVGESITLGSGANSKTVGMVIQNGFVLPVNLDLYYQNARVKRLMLEYNEIAEIAEIDDTPHPQVIYFKEELSTKVKITILDVYQGEKYEDTAISNILFLEKNSRP